MNYLGIDLGTTFSAVAYLSGDGRPTTIPNAEGELTTPSVVLFDAPDNLVVGRDARRAALAEPTRVAWDVKRFIGDHAYPRQFFGRHYSPVELSAIILRKLKQDAERVVGAVSGAVITVPAYFDEVRRQATAQAGELAGIDVVDIVNEPTAAALAYSYKSLLSAHGVKKAVDGWPALESDPQNVMVYDLGGGTFDVTILRIHGRDLTVLATAGDVQLGGRDWDARIVEHFAKLFAARFHVNPLSDPQSSQQFNFVAEDTKKELSRRATSRFSISHAGHSLTGELNRHQFEELTADLLFRTESRVKRVLEDAKLSWDQIVRILITGGSTRMPQVGTMLARVTGRNPDDSLSPDEAVAHGAAIHAAICVSRGASGVQSVRSPLIYSDAPDAGNAPPGSPDETGAPEMTQTVDDDLAAAAAQVRANLSAPVAASNSPARSFLALLGDSVRRLLQSIRVTNVASHSLGVVVTDKRGRQAVAHLLLRNSPLPARAVKTFGTEKANQSRVVVLVVEGEAAAPSGCSTVGLCTISDLPPGLPKGSPVQVRFCYDASGRLSVEAIHVPSGTWAKTLIQRRAGVDPAKIQLSRDLLMRLSVS